MTPEELLAALQKLRSYYVSTTRGGREVHAIWRDTMIAQRRPVATERMSWDTLSVKDRALDHTLAAALVDDFLLFAGEELAKSRT